MKTLFIGRHLISLESVDSTNGYARDFLSRNDLFEGTVIIAAEQTNGKGQRGNVWYSSPRENLTLSIILKPHFLDLNCQFDLSKAIALSVADFFTYYTNYEIKVKWPNDILIESKKAAGILIENIYQGDKISHSIAGIGINVNQLNFPAKLIHAGSLKLATGFHFNINECLEKLCENIERRYLQLKSNNKKIDEDYLSKLFRLNEWGNFSTARGDLLGKIKGVKKNGRLTIQFQNGEILDFDNKEIEFIY